MYRVYGYIFSASVIILTILVYLFILTGYDLLLPGAFSGFTGGIIGYRDSIIIHSGLITRLFLVIVVTLHGLTGFTIIASKIRRRVLRKATIIIIHLVFVAMIIYLILIEVRMFVLSSIVTS